MTRGTEELLRRAINLPEAQFKSEAKVLRPRSDVALDGAYNAMKEAVVRGGYFYDLSLLLEPFLYLVGKWHSLSFGCLYLDDSTRRSRWSEPIKAEICKGAALQYVPWSVPSPRQSPRFSSLA